MKSWYLIIFWRLGVIFEKWKRIKWKIKRTKLIIIINYSFSREIQGRKWNNLLKLIELNQVWIETRNLSIINWK